MRHCGRREHRQTRRGEPAQHEILVTLAEGRTLHNKVPEIVRPETLYLLCGKCWQFVEMLPRNANPDAVHNLLEANRLIRRRVVLSDAAKYATYLRIPVPPDYKVGFVSVADNFDRGSISVQVRFAV